MTKLELNPKAKPAFEKAEQERTTRSVWDDPYAYAPKHFTSYSSPAIDWASYSQEWVEVTSQYEKMKAQMMAEIDAMHAKRLSAQMAAPKKQEAPKKNQTWFHVFSNKKYYY
jgi:hypothetical protein